MSQAQADVLKPQITEYVRRLEVLAAEKKALTERLETLNSDIHKIRGDALPELLAQLDMPSACLESGHKLEVKSELTCKLPSRDLTYSFKDRVTGEITERHLRDDALEKIVSYGEEAIIKNNVVAIFNRAEREKALAALALLQETGCEDVEMIPDVHHSSLKSMIGRRLKDGLELDLDLFNVRIQKVVSVKLGRTEIR